MKFKKEAFRKMIKNEIRKLLDDDMIREPPVVGDPNFLAYASREKTCKDCGKSPCTSQDDPSICGSCRVNPCECGYADIMEQKLTCTACGGILFLEGDCGCKKQVSMFTPHDAEEDDNDAPIAYMAKSQLMKITKYSQKLQHMIHDDHNLDDWMRSHIAQAADDIGEVYHKLDYQFSIEED